MTSLAFKLPTIPGPVVRQPASNLHSPSLQSLMGDLPVVIVPGLNNSDQNHWQSLWQAQLPNSRRIFVHDWSQADLDTWRQGIQKALRGLPAPALLVGHSFGALAAASVANDFPEQVAGVLLVAPADPDKFRIAARLPQDVLPVPGTLIASDNDPWIRDSKAAFWALVWGAQFLRLKGLGHINSDSAIGHWPEGIEQLARLVQVIKRERRIIK